MFIKLIQLGVFMGRFELNLAKTIIQHLHDTLV